MKKWLIGVILFAAAAAAGMGIYLSGCDFVSVAVIGGADGPTSMFVAGKVGKDSLILMAAGAGLILAAGVAAGYHLHRRMKRR